MLRSLRCAALLGGLFLSASALAVDIDPASGCAYAPVDLDDPYLLATNGLPINLVWLKSRQGLPKVSALLDALAACLTPAGHHTTRPAVPR